VACGSFLREANLELFVADRVVAICIEEIEELPELALAPECFGGGAALVVFALVIVAGAIVAGAVVVLGGVALVLFVECQHLIEVEIVIVICVGRVPKLLNLVVNVVVSVGGVCGVAVAVGGVCGAVSGKAIAVHIFKSRVGAFGGGVCVVVIVVGGVCGVVVLARCVCLFPTIKLDAQRNTIIFIFEPPIVCVVWGKLG